MAKKVGIKDDIFPPVLETGTLMGSVTCKQSGLSSSTKVVMGAGDVQLGCAGLGVVDEGQVAILDGSFWQQVVNIPSSTLPPEDMDIRVNPHVIDGLSQAEGIGFFSGLVMRWFRDTFCDLEKIEAKSRGVDIYTLLEAKAKDIPAGSYGILPIFSDSMKYGRWYHASPSFLNLSFENSNKHSIFKSLQENACIVSKINLKKIEKFSAVKISSVVFAGGASKGELWSQTLADVLGCTVKIPKVTEATALGASMAAGVGVGIYKDLSFAAKKLVQWDKKYEPNMKNHVIYSKIEQNWQKAYEMQLRLVDSGITTSMWKAPGL